MKANDLILVSVDDHVVEPPTLFEGRLPARFADLAPKVVTNDQGADVWVFNDSVVPNIGLNAVAGRPRRSTASSPRRSTRCAAAAGTCTSGSRT